MSTWQLTIVTCALRRERSSRSASSPMGASRVAVVGRPVARNLDDGLTAEITRVASTGVPHAASKSIAAATRASLALGYQRLVSYTLVSEQGTSYRAAGWRPTAVTAGGHWSRRGRHREAAVLPGHKVRWEIGPRAATLCPFADALARSNEAGAEAGQAIARAANDGTSP